MAKTPRSKTQANITLMQQHSSVKGKILVRARYGYPESDNILPTDMLTDTPNPQNNRGIVFLSDGYLNRALRRQAEVQKRQAAKKKGSR
ncbi:MULTISPECIES: hypothetical protein [Xenorhabdus]|uniref:hypothetical protein n=1 Tax=Xenorhabdus TaxID=626 RepID=UPI00064A9187|nr:MULTISPECIES: hypothetical protein [Xenorhabdus]KLU14165.1 hypothetical protein AAY47_17885 [Xenorhabdus griffiniae]KOP32966.1 hypothetical protein AFK69_13070 [Xenorhabdus sp. GDc328]